MGAGGGFPLDLESGVCCVGSAEASCVDMGDDGVGAFGCAYEEGASAGFGGKEGEWMVVGQEWVGGEECGQAGGVDACAVVYVVLCLHGDASVGRDGCPGL